MSGIAGECRHCARSDTTVDVTLRSQLNSRRRGNGWHSCVGAASESSLWKALSVALLGLATKGAGGGSCIE